MKLAAWKYFSMIMAVVLALGTGVIALVPAAPTAADNALTHGQATDNATGKHPHGPAGASENRTHHYPGLSQHAISASGFAPSGSASWYVNGELGTNNGSHGTGPGSDAFKTIQYALGAASSGDTIYIAGLAQYSTDSYEEGLTISKNISLVGDGADTTEIWVNEGYSTVSLTGAGLNVSISGIYIHHNNAWSINGGCISAADSTLTLNNVELWGEGDEGGGIYVDNCTLVASDSWISGSAHFNGGGLHANDSVVTLNRCIFWGPDAVNNGGGMYAYGSDVNMADCYFNGDENGGAGAGGAIYVNSSILTAVRCSFYENYADGDGGAIYINAADDNCTVSMSNCTFNYNYTDYGSDGYGGAIFMYSYTGGPAIAANADGYSASLALTGCTFFDNEADGNGGGLAQQGAESITAISNCIFDNSAYDYDNILMIDSLGTVNSSYSLYSDDPDLTSSDHDITEQDSLCYDMADNGGLTPTCAIDSTSLARGAGSDAGLATDQRGVVRGGAPYDIGAYQWIGPTYADNGKANDSGDGLSWATAKKHVFAAANLAGPGSTAFVAAGTYLGEYHWDNFDLDYYNIDIYKPLTLTGAGAASTIIDDSASHGDYWDDTILDVYDGATDVWDEGAVTISGFTLRNAQGEDCYGGGLYVDSGGVTTVRDCVMEDNYAGYGGGGVNIEDAGEVALTGCTIVNNTAADDGGGICVSGADNVTISGCTVNGNEATDGCFGGGIYFDDCDIFSLSDSTVNGNTSSGNGGGIYGDYMYTYDEVDSPYYNTSISRCSIDNNTSIDSGGGIYFYQVNDYAVTIEACTLSNNQAGINGGGLYNDSSSKATLTNCTIYGNSLITVGSSISANEAPPEPPVVYTRFGGGIYNAGDAELLNCTVASNDAGPDGTGGGYYEFSGYTGVFENTILANNSADGAANDIAGDGSVTSNGHNICTTDASAYFTDPTDNVSTDPSLGDLQDNGGPTFTCAIGSISPAFNTAETGPATDQRGIEYPRPALGGYDVGAFELQGIIPPTPTAPTITAITPASGNQGQCPMTVVITGTNLTGATAVSFGTGITVSSFVVNSATQITATICIAPDAIAGTRNVSVTTPGGTGTRTGSFTVVQQTQQVGSGAPTSHGSSTTGPSPVGQPVGLPNIVIQSAAISVRTVTPGTPITIVADIANKSAVNGNKRITLYVNGQVESTQGITVNSGGSTQLTFNVSRSEPGNYMVYVDGVPAGSFKVELFRESDMVLIFSITMLAMAFIVGVIMIWRRQRAY